jgi:hypothetical protein
VAIFQQASTFQTKRAERDFIRAVQEEWGSVGLVIVERSRKLNINWQEIIGFPSPSASSVKVLTAAVLQSSFDSTSRKSYKLLTQINQLLPQTLDKVARKALRKDDPRELAALKCVLDFRIAFC